MRAKHNFFNFLAVAGCLLVTSCLAAPLLFAQDQNDPFEEESKLSREEVTKLLNDHLPATSDSDSEIRRAAVKAVAEICNSHGRSAAAALTPLMDRLGDTHADIREVAIEGLIKIGRLAVTAIRKKMDDPKSLIRANAIAAASRFSDRRSTLLRDIRKHLKDESQEVRQASALALATLKDSSEETVSALFLMSESSSAAERGTAFSVLPKILTGDVESQESLREKIQTRIIAGLRDKDAEARAGAIMGLPLLNWERGKVEPLLRNAIRDPDARVVYSATVVSGSDSRNIPWMSDPPVSAAILRMYRECVRNPPVSWDEAKVVQVLGDLGDRSKEIIPVLLERMQKGEPAVIGAGAVALFKIDRRTSESFPILARCLHGGEHAVLAACKAVAEIGADASPMVDDLLAVLTKMPMVDSEFEASAETLQHLATKNPRVLQSLIGALDNLREEVLSTVAGAITSIGRDAVPALAEALDANKIHRTLQIAKILASLERDAAAAVVPLKALLNHEIMEVRFECALALAIISRDPASIPVLLQIYDEEDADFERIAAAQRQIAQFGNQVIPHLLDALRDENILDRPWVFYLLANADPQASTAVITELQKRINDEDPALRSLSSIALANLAPSDACVPLIEEFFNLFETYEGGIGQEMPNFSELEESAWKGLLKCSERGRLVVISRLRDGDEDRRGRFVRALKGNQTSLLPSLQSMHDLADGDVRLLCIVAMAGIDRTPERLQKIAPFIQEDFDISVRRAAVGVIGEYGVAAKSLLPMLQKIAKEPEQELQYEIQESIALIEAAMQQTEASESSK